MTIAELLLIYACASSSGCEPTRVTYIHHNPEVKEIVESKIRKVKSSIPLFVTDNILPIAALATRREITIPINKNISVGYELNTVNTKMIYAWEL